MRRGLLIVGHGSTENPDSSTPYWRHADEIRARGIYDRVECCFWKEFPALTDAGLLMSGMDEVDVVPAFISEGYFTGRVVPRELGWGGGSREGWVYCEAVGTHAGMAEVILRHVREVSPGVKPGDTTVVVVGHGTGLDANSRRAVEDQAEAVRGLAPEYAAVVAAFMEEAPEVSKWREWARTPEVVVVPFFIADGLHSYQDIPVLLGIEEDEGDAASRRQIFRNNPYEFGSQRLWYSRAIGTDPGMVDVIVERADAGRNGRGGEIVLREGASDGLGGTDFLSPEYWEAFFVAGVEGGGGKFSFGEVEIRRTTSGSWFLGVAGDSGEVIRVKDNGELRWGVRNGFGGRQVDYRPLPMAKGMPCGWEYEAGSDIGALVEALQVIYPMSLLRWRALADAKSNGLDIVGLRDKLRRQTGMFRGMGEIDGSILAGAVEKICGNCLNKRLWDLEGRCANATGCFVRTPGLYCPEPCNYLLAKLKGEVSGPCAGE